MVERGQKNPLSEVWNKRDGGVEGWKNTAYGRWIRE